LEDCLRLPKLLAKRDVRGTFALGLFLPDLPSWLGLLYARIESFLAEFDLVAARTSLLSGEPKRRDEFLAEDVFCEREEVDFAS
jgi:hypothetical protein